MVKRKCTCIKEVTRETVFNFNRRRSEERRGLKPRGAIYTIDKGDDLEYHKLLNSYEVTRLGGEHPVCIVSEKEFHAHFYSLHEDRKEKLNRLQKIQIDLKNSGYENR